MPYIQVHQVAIPFCLRRSQRAKRLQMALRQNRFEIVAPTRMSNHVILSFVWQQRHWMLKALRSKSASVWPKGFLPSENIAYRGEQKILHLKYGAKPAVALIAHALVFTLPLHKTPCEQYESKIKKMLTIWYQEQAKQIIQNTIDKYCLLLGQWPKSFHLKQQKTRWGSCGIDQKIYLNWVLVLAPIGVLEYVVVHELCHLLHRNHGKRFWAKVAQCMPDFEYYEKWLRQHGASLHPHAEVER